MFHVRIEKVRIRGKWLRVSREDVREKERKKGESDDQTGDSREGERNRNIKDIEMVELQHLVCKNVLLRSIIK